MFDRISRIFILVWQVIFRWFKPRREDSSDNMHSLEYAERADRLERAMLDRHVGILEQLIEKANRAKESPSAGMDRNVIAAISDLVQRTSIDDERKEAIRGAILVALRAPDNASFQIAFNNLFAELAASDGDLSECIAFAVGSYATCFLAGVPHIICVGVANAAFEFWAGMTQGFSDVLEPPEPETCGATSIDVNGGTYLASSAQQCERVSSQTLYDVYSPLCLIPPCSAFSAWTECTPTGRTVAGLTEYQLMDHVRCV